MAAEHLPFELISLPPADPAARRAAEKRDLLAQHRLPGFLSSHQWAALRYQPSNELLLAINMALHTGSPLLLAGEPGTGKTQAADFVGAYFGIPVYKFLVKSTSAAQDLLYEFDAVGYLHWAQSAGWQPAMQPATEQGAWQQSSDAIATETQAVRLGFLHKRALWEAYETDGDAVVLIDEIDKAPRDFPNDLLHELDQHSFPHPFDPRTMIRPRSERPPIIIATSNEERRLPDAFLRRCIFHRIELTPTLVEAAVESMARTMDDGSDGINVGAGFLNLDRVTRDAARKRFWEIRELPGLEKKPSTAELLTWLCILSARRIDAHTLEQSGLKDLPGKEALIKDYEDLQRLG
jgi:MoxR-like ATPase